VRSISQDITGQRPVPLQDIFIPNGLTVLFLGPHPDDFDAVGVTMSRLQAGGAIIHVAVDRSGSGIEDGYCSPPTPEVKAAIREEEHRRSCRFFGLPDDRLTFLGLDEDDTAQLLDSPRNTDLLRGLLASLRPGWVILPHGHDTNVGHQRMVAMARRIAPEAGYPIAALFNRDPKTISLRPDIYTAFGEEDAQWKAQLLRFHDSQQQRNLNTRGHGFDKRILNTNRQIARELGLRAPYAEAFEVEIFGA
jgi:LmbE family N-acetylglucosaminyl deacetylase